MDEKRELALQAVKRDLMRIGGEGPPEEGWRNKGPSGGGGEDWDGGESAGDKGRPATPQKPSGGGTQQVMIEEYGAVNMNLAEALRQRNELRHKVEQLELEKIVVERRPSKTGGWQSCGNHGRGRPRSTWSS